MARATGTSPAADDADRDRSLRLLAGVGARPAGGIDDYRLPGAPCALSAPALPSHAATLCSTLAYPHLPSPQALHNVVMWATDLALYPDGTEGSADVGTAFATYTGLNVLIVLLAALLTLWAPSAGSSGLPKLKSYLNGTLPPPCILRPASSALHTPHSAHRPPHSTLHPLPQPTGTYMRNGMLSPSTLVAKVVGITLITSTNMPLGRDGPMVHIGAPLQRERHQLQRPHSPTPSSVSPSSPT